VEEHCGEIADASVDVKFAQGAESKVHGVASSAQPTAGATMIGGTNPGNAR